MTRIVIFLSAAFFLGFLSSSCGKKETPREIAESLKTTMNIYLNHDPRIDNSRVKFNVLDVVYFEDRSAYVCEFKVNMKEKTKSRIIDTTGTMGARISKDYKTVSRNR
jgi:hypothetical protein